MSDIIATVISPSRIVYHLHANGRICAYGGYNWEDVTSLFNGRWRDILVLCQRKTTLLLPVLPVCPFLATKVIPHHHKGKTMRTHHLYATAPHTPGDLEVWWVPQFPMQPFHVPVVSVEEGVKILHVLADYDTFQWENHVKGDYANAGGLRRWCLDSDGNGTAGWEDWYDEETGEDDPDAFCVRRRHTDTTI